jgi:hypothetical protein
MDTFSWWVLLALGALTIGFWVNHQISYQMRRFMRVRTAAWLNVSYVATELPSQVQIPRIETETLSGDVDDYYDPLRRKLRLSNPAGNSIAEFAMIAQETGLLIQHQQALLLFMPIWGIAALAKLVALAAAIILGLGLLAFVPFIGYPIRSLMAALDWDLATAFSYSLAGYVLSVLATLPMATLRWQTNHKIFKLLAKLPGTNAAPTPEEIRQFSHMMKLLIWRDLRDVALVWPGIFAWIRDRLSPRRR